MDEDRVMAENSNEGGCGVPRLDPATEEIIANDCARECGGTKFIGIPIFVPTVTNPPDGTTFLPGS